MGCSLLMPHYSYLMPCGRAGKSVKRICKPNSVSVACARDEDHSSATRVAAVVEQPTRKLSADTGQSTASLFGLAPQGVCHAVAAHAGRGALLPHHFTLTRRPVLRAGNGRYLSVALSVALPRLDVIQPAARRSSDFPPSRRCGTAILRSASRDGQRVGGVGNARVGHEVPGRRYWSKGPVPHVPKCLT